MEKDRMESLINRAQSGDLQAMEKLLEVAHTSVSYQCRKMMPRQEDAEDLTQEVLLAVYQKIDTLKEAKAFWSWLNRITATHCMNALSRNHVDLQFAEDEAGHSIVDDLEVLDEHLIPDKALDSAETARMIDEIVSGLPEAQRMSTLLYYYNEMSVKEIAQIMNVPENTVKSRLNLARKAIKDKVLDYEKQGVKLYSVSILPFLWYFLRTAAESQANTGAAAACASGVMAAGTATGGTATAVGGTAVAGEVVAHVAAGKVIALIMACITALGGVSFGTIQLINQYGYPVPAVICQHEWSDANCIEPRTCSKCNSVDGEAIGHHWQDATCESPKTCTICEATAGEAAHIWIDANYQEPKTCSACGTSNGDPAMPAFKTYGLSVVDMELGREYSYITSCNDKAYKTTGQAVFSHFRVFDGDETHEAVDGYEWYSIAVDITFSDENAQKYGMYPFVFFCDYYTGGEWAGDSEEFEEKTGTTFTINYYGKEYTECIIYPKDAGSLGWVANTCIYHCEFNYRVPAGYDGIIIGLMDPSVDPRDGQTVADFVYENTLFFRPNNNSATEGYKPITLVSYSPVNKNWYIMQDCALYAEPSYTSEQLLACEKGRAVTVFCTGTNGWSYGTLKGVSGYIPTECTAKELPKNPGKQWIQQLVGIGQGFIYVEVPDSYTGAADPKTGLSWDGVSPIIYTYPNGTTGTEPVEGATYEFMPGVICTYEILRDGAGRPDGSICEQCGRTVAHSLSSGVYCVQDSVKNFCSDCGTWIEAYECHTCENYVEGISYCNHCEKVRGDGSNGTCLRYLMSGHNCDSCGVFVPAQTCHTCDEE